MTIKQFNKILSQKPLLKPFFKFSLYVMANTLHVACYFYCNKHKILCISFKTGDYAYLNVPPQKVSSLRRAKSFGKFLQKHIIDKYPTVRLSSPHNCNSLCLLVKRSRFILRAFRDVSLSGKVTIK